MYFRQLLNENTACASLPFGRETHSQFAVVDPHVDVVDEYSEHTVESMARTLYRSLAQLLLLTRRD
ncbi:MAG: hypothetical protein ACYCUM_08805 [Solirubrobacteraceae bacterium]